MINAFIRWVLSIVDRAMGQILRTVPALSDDNGICDSLSGVADTFHSVTWFVPAFALQVSFTMIMTVLIPVVLIQLVRLISSYLTGGGGAV